MSSKAIKELVVLLFFVLPSTVIAVLMVPLTYFLSVNAVVKYCNRDNKRREKEEKIKKKGEKES